MTYAEIQTKLLAEADEGYREFVTGGTPTERPILGVRIPQIRKLAKSIARGDFPAVLNARPVAMEEVMLRGMVICRMDYAEMLTHFDSQIAIIDDWGTCDTFCAGLRPVIKGHLGEFYDLKIATLLADSREFAVRAGLVLLLGSYVTPDYLAVIFEHFETLAAREEYYIRMAIAWLLAECFIKLPEATLSYMEVSKLPKWTYNKAISKMCDSLRVDDETKAVLRKMRKS